MQKNFAVLVEEMYQELEVWYPYLRLKEEGIETKLIGREKGIVYHGKYGNYPAKAELGINEAFQYEWSGVFIPGGFAPDYMRRTPAFIEFVNKLHNEKRLLAAICHGPWILASADIIKDVKLTAFFAIKDDLIHAGAEYVDAPYVVDKNIITARKPEDLPQMLKKIVSLLKDV